MAGMMLACLSSLGGCATEPSVRSYELIGKARPAIAPDAVLRRLKQEAASLGASALLLREIDRRAGPSVDADVAGGYSGARGTANLGRRLSTAAERRYGWGIAAYLPP
jgi:hypothetical protein